MNNIFAQHNKWIRIALTLGAKEDAEDMVQEAYIKCLGKEVNETYFYFCLRNTIIDEMRRNKKEIYCADQSNYFLTESLYSQIDKWNAYDKKLYLLYIETKLSMRDIAKETGISLTSIYNSIKNCNERIKHYLENEHEVQY